VFKYYFSNTWTGLGYSRVSLYSLGVEIEVFPYTQGHKVTTNDRPMTQEPAELSLQLHGIIAENM